MAKITADKFYRIISMDIFVEKKGAFTANLTYGQTFLGMAWMANVSSVFRSQTGQFWSTEEEARTEALEILEKMNAEKEKRDAKIQEEFNRLTHSKEETGEEK